MASITSSTWEVDQPYMVPVFKDDGGGCNARQWICNIAYIAKSVKSGGWYGGGDVSGFSNVIGVPSAHVNL